MKRLALLVSLVMVACGPSAGSDDDDDDNTGGIDAAPGLPDAYTGPVGTISGTVWAPGNAPGMVPAGQEIPIFDALVYLSFAPPPQIPQETHCEQCVDPPGKAIFSDHQGNFTIPNVVPNTYWLVIQKGQFRIEQQLLVGENAVITLPPEGTTLPSTHDPANGRWVPRIAIAAGNYDHLEDILGKMGLGEVDGSGRYVANSAAGNIDVYSNGNGDLDGVALGTLTNLWSSGAYLDYHIIFIPCASNSNTAALSNGSGTLEAIQDFVRKGGKLYVTDWSGEWNDNVFPAQIMLEGSSNDTPASAYTAGPPQSWNTGQFGSADGSLYESENAEAIDDDLFAWLNGQSGPTALSASISTYDASNFVVEGNWNTITALTDVTIGEDDKGFPVVDEPKAWVIGGHGTSLPKQPLTVSHEPVGCGRVLFSTYHTTNDIHVGLVPQERVLLYLIMEIGVCKSGPIID
jgi:hypothetical protein